MVGQTIGNNKLITDHMDNNVEQFDNFKCLVTIYSPLTDKNFVNKFCNPQNASDVSQETTF